MNKPDITPGIDFFDYTWPELKVRVTAQRYDLNGHAELLFFSRNGTDELLLDQNNLNLLSASSKHSQAKKLERLRPDVPWDDALTWVTSLTVDAARRGELAQTVWPNEEDNLTADYLLEPFLYRNHPNVVFGDYGSLKSLFALVVGYVVQLPYPDNGLGLITPAESTHCLYLDYEDDPSSFRKRWGAIQRGFGVGAAMPIEYWRMTGTIADSVENLQHAIAEKDIKLLIIDSLGPAARGNLNDPEPAIKYHEALRKLRTNEKVGITSLTLAHNSKDPLTKKRTIFGSVFFTNLARSVWECKAEQEAGEDEAIISLKQHKANLSKKHLPLGYRFTFTSNSIAIARTDLKDTGLSGELPLRYQIRNLLKEGAMPIQELAERLNSNADSVGRTLRRMRRDNQAINLEDGTWGLSV